MRLAFDDVSYSATRDGAAKKKRGRGKKAARPPRPSGATRRMPVWALRDVSFAVEPGEFFGVAGHTGRGEVHAACSI